MKTDKERVEELSVLARMLYDIMVYYAFAVEGGGFSIEKSHKVCRYCKSGATGSGFDISTIVHSDNCETGDAIDLYNEWMEENEKR